MCECSAHQCPLLGGQESLPPTPTEGPDTQLSHMQQDSLSLLSSFLQSYS